MAAESIISVSSAAESFTTSWASPLVFDIYFVNLVFVSDEKTFDQLTPVLGSGPGLIYEICKSFEQELIDLSLGEDLSRKLVSELFKGSAELSLGQGKSFAALADEVSSPGGITEKMLETYTEKSMSDGFKAIFQSGRNKGDTL